MRVRTYHRHNTQRSSTLLALLLCVHPFISFVLTTPVLFVFLSRRWSLAATTRGTDAWMLALSLVWLVAEIARLILGVSANKKMRMAQMISFVCLTVCPQMVAFWIFYSMWPDRNPLEYSLCVVHQILLLAELLLSVRLLWRLGRNNTIDFYVYLGQHNASVNRYTVPNGYLPPVY
ncbi:hypothetical protein STCU_00128 [Strigomonas culicis]|uniref:Uncharacterized protein n=1 Tax=Strigomonas culicis TaxID=28005 RepID=S9UJA4_9TRYP|nr:hypothetical protein STCU_03806 [Strigomonas culicis]EPY37169.1 hypothetical protein STCU_00128 [Strigomonas culicis]|eukprot:EPY30897.1 hypothetical protein STCU_03806 [Strigomonas culicis]